MQNFDFIDIHSHLDFSDYQKDFDEVLDRMKLAKVATITIGTDLESSKRALKIAEENENVWACIGVHPADNHKEVWNEEEFAALVENPRTVAIGECGLDFYRLSEDTNEAEIEKARQEKLFKSQIEFAIKYKKPLMIHCREAYEETLEILEEYKKTADENLRGNFHFYAGSKEHLNRILNLGFTVSYTGVITFAKDYEDLIKATPIDKIHIETDAPFVAPVPYRGHRNEPSYVVEVFKKMAQIKGISEEMLQKQLQNNAQKLFF